MSEGSDRLVGKRLADTYQVIRLISRGGMGAIYEATHVRLQGKRYAIKVLIPRLADDLEALTRFRREAEIASQLGNDNIVAVHDFNVSEGMAYMVMDLLEGEDLAARLRTRGRLPLDQVKRIIDQIASALDTAHRAQIVHRDLKPQNVFLCRRGSYDDHIKLLDFGVSKILDSVSVLTSDNALVGTPFYMSPEQAEGRVKEIDQRTDVFAFGAMIWEMLTGTMAFAAPTFGVALYRVCTVDPPDVHTLSPHVPPTVSLVLRRALAKDRMQRTPTVIDVAAEFTAALHGIAPTELPAVHGGITPSAQQMIPMIPSAQHMIPMTPSAQMMPMMPTPSAQMMPMMPTPSAQMMPMTPSAQMIQPAVGVTVASVMGPPMHPAMPWQPPSFPGGLVATPHPGHGQPVQAMAPMLATGSLLAQRPPRSRVPFIMLGLAGGIVGVAIAITATRSQPGVSAPQPAVRAAATIPPEPPAQPVVEPTQPVVEPARVSPEPVTAPNPGEVVVAFTVEPRDAAAEITVGDEKVHELMVRVAKSSSPQTITAEAKGYATFHGNVVPDHDQRVTITLKRKPGARPVKAPEPMWSPPPSQPADVKPAVTDAPKPAPVAASPVPSAQPAPVSPPAAVAPPPVVTQPPAAPPPPAQPPKKKKTGTIFDD